jgi:uncharacterized membrane protein YidH (DUF202 family)
MSRIRCPGCGSLFPEEGLSNRCPRCDADLTVAEIESDVQVAKPRRGPWARLVRRFRKGVLVNREVEFLETGPEVRRTLEKTLNEMAHGVLLVLIGLVFLPIGPYVIAVRLGVLPRGLQWAAPPPVWLILFTLACGALGLLCVLIGILVAMVSATRYWRGERLILGKTYLQCILDEKNGIFQIPYETISDLRLLQTHGDVLEATGKNLVGQALEPFIGINVADRRRSDMFGITRNTVLGFDHTLNDLYDLPLDELFDKIVKRWLKATGKAGRRQEQDAKAFRRRARLNRIAIYGLSALAVALVLFALIGVVLFR